MKVYVIEKCYCPDCPEEYWDVYKVTRDEEEAGRYASYADYEVTEWEVK